MQIGLSLLIPAVVLNMVMGILIAVRGRHKTSSRYFAISVFGIVGWALGTYIMLAADGVQLAKFGQIIFLVSPLVTTLFCVFFTRTFPRNNQVPMQEKALFYIITLCLVIAIVAWPAFFTKELALAANGTNVLTIHKAGYSIYAAYFFILFLIAYLNLIRSLKKSSSYQRNQIIYSFAGIFFTSFLALTTNLFMPLIGIGQYLWLGSLWTIFYLIGASVAIVKYRLFDIRLIIVRTLAYLLTLLVLVGVYIFLAGVVAVVFFSDTERHVTSQHAGYIAILVALALTFGPLKNRFDKLTRRLFYRDGYDTQEILDKISSVLVRTVAMDELTQKTITAVCQAIKADSGTLFVVGNKRTSSQVVRVGEGAEDSEILAAHILSVRQSMVLADEIENQSSSLYRALRDAHISMAIRLETSGEVIGCLLLGDKVSGSMYSGQDVALVRIVADELAVAVQNALRFEEISQFNLTLKKEVADATAELRATNKRLRELDKAKDEFLSMASHQLRTPLTSVKGYLSMALEGDAGKLNTGQEHLLKESYASAQRMVYLVNDFLNVSRINTGKFVVDRTSVALNELIQQEINQLRPEAKVRNIKLDIAVPEHFARARLDESKVRQVVMNLIDNAIYYSKESGTVAIALSQSDDWAEFTVRDHGIGVPKDEQPHMFEKFFRATNAKKVRTDGTGVGLYVAKKVITSHGGEIIFSSEPGRGSTFGFRVPLTAERAHVTATATG